MGAPTEQGHGQDGHEEGAAQDAPKIPTCPRCRRQHRVIAGRYMLMDCNPPAVGP